LPGLPAARPLPGGHDLGGSARRADRRRSQPTGLGHHRHEG